MGSSPFARTKIAAGEAAFFYAEKGQSLRIPSPSDIPRARGMLSPISPSVASLLRSHKITAGMAAFLFFILGHIAGVSLPLADEGAHIGREFGIETDELARTRMDKA